jgi:hypothetical protein
MYIRLYQFYSVALKYDKIIFNKTITNFIILVLKHTCFIFILESRLFNTKNIYGSP